MLSQHLLQLYAESFRENWDLPAVTDYTDGFTMTYGDFARRIARTHLFLRECGVRPGDRVALLGKNTAMWVTSFMAVITYGAVIVPILPDFSPQDATHIINHSGSVMLFVNESIWEHLEYADFKHIKVVMSLDNHTKVLQEHPRNSGKAEQVLAKLPKLFDMRYPLGFRREDVSYIRLKPDSVAEINYTSGTTGFSKGVMLTHNNLCGNVVYGISTNLHYRTSRGLSFLPLAHAYGCAFDMLTPLATGSHITLFGKVPSPRLLVEAMKKIKPTIIFCVPLVLEKIYRKQILPQLERPAVKRMLKIPLVRSQIYAKIRNSLTESLGGQFEEVVVGGAALNPEVEEFLHRIKFRFTVGYGMTECGPLISFTPWQQFLVGSVGRTLPEIMESKVLPTDNRTVTYNGREYPIGEVCVRGENVMKGYYKNPEATAAVLDSDGWLHTGDMGFILEDGTIFLKGRCKTMILSASGQNIYPEEIEAKLNNLPYVAESLVVERGPKLVALVYPDYEAMDRGNITSDDLPKVMDDNLATLNRVVAPYERIASIQLIPNEFEKTPKKSIKRYLYR